MNKYRLACNYMYNFKLSTLHIMCHKHVLTTVCKIYKKSIRNIVQGVAIFSTLLQNEFLCINARLRK